MHRIKCPNMPGVRASVFYSTGLVNYYCREDLVLYALFAPKNKCKIREDLVQLAGKLSL